MTEEQKAAIEEMKQILGKLKAGQLGDEKWSEKTRDNEKHGGIINKPGERK